MLILAIFVMTLCVFALVAAWVYFWFEAAERLELPDWLGFVLAIGVPLAAILAVALGAN